MLSVFFKEISCSSEETLFLQAIRSSASVTENGKIHDPRGLWFNSPAKWLSSLMGGQTIKKAKAYELVKCLILLAVEFFPKQALVFTCLHYRSFENTVGKGEIARNEEFLFLPQCFLPFWKTFCHFHQIKSCRLQTLLVWKTLKFVIWERVNYLPSGKLLDWSKWKTLADKER